MQLKRFSVKGFKNIRTEIVLDDIGAISVIHGENNVGKSNVLEAMQLFFQLLTLSERTTWVQQMTSSELEQLGFIASEIFNLEFIDTIKLNATFNNIEVDELGIKELLPTSEVQINLQLKPVLGDFEYMVTKFRFADGTDVTQEPANAEQTAFARKLARFLAQSTSLLNPKEKEKRFELISVDRHISLNEIEARRSVVPQSLRLQLYDAKESLEFSSSNKWKLFANTLQKFHDVLGIGEFVAIFNRHTNRANLVFESASARTPNATIRIPIDMLGSGIQQVVAIIARLLISHASFVAIEEPELNLRYTLQLRLREVLYEIVKAPVGPQQIFLTSHSPAFEFGEHFYAMSATDNHGPTIKRLPIKTAHFFTEHDADMPNIGETASQCYVSSDRLVRLPEDICKELGIEQGGGIVILKRQDNEHVELLTNEQFLELFEPVNNE
jgi:AAA15 family ATPase/GTPase